MFKISFLPKYHVNYYAYIIKWCFGLQCNWCVSLDISESLALSNAVRRCDDGCHVSRPLLLVACTFMAQDADATTACSSAVSTHVGVL